jgi:hypothetical protein
MSCLQGQIHTKRFSKTIRTKMLTQQSPPFANPYPGLRNEDDPEGIVHRVNVDVLKADTDQIRSVSVDQGTTTTIIKMFIKFISNECRRNNWTLNERQQLVDLVRERCTPTQRGAADSVDERPNANDRRGVGSMGATAKSDQDKLSPSAVVEEAAVGKKHRGPKEKTKSN